MNFRRVFGLALAIFVAGSLAVGCYDDSELRASIDNLKSQLEQLRNLVSTLQNDDSVTGVTQNPDGSYSQIPSASQINNPVSLLEKKG